MKKIFVLPFMLLVQWAYGQVLLTSQIPYTGLYMKSQLWNFSVVNMGDAPVNIRVELTFSNASTGQVLFTAKSGMYPLTQKVSQLQYHNLSPVLYTIVDNTFNINPNPEGLLPIGRFVVCYSVVLESGANKVDEECTAIEVEPISPPVLISPGNYESSDSRRPFFSWIAPAPSFGFNNLSYDFSLVSVDGTQTPGDAIQQNLPIFSQSNFAFNSFLYPASLPELDTSKLYAWQVTAKGSDNAFAQSEIFSFKVRQYNMDTSQSTVIPDFYVPLKKENDASYYVFSNEVNYQYLNEINDSFSTYNIFDISGAVPKNIVIAAPLTNLKYGQNFISTDISGYTGFVAKHMYLLELINSRQEHWYLKFEYRKPVNN